MTRTVFSTSSPPVRFGNDPVRAVLMIGRHRLARPLSRGVAPAAIFKHIAVAVLAKARDDDSGFVGFLAACHGRIDRHNDAPHFRQVDKADARPFEHFPVPQRAWRVG